MPGPPTHEDGHRITVEVSAKVRLSADELWPDGDAPVWVSAKAVRQAIEAESVPSLMWYGGALDGELFDAVQVRVTVPTPGWQPLALFPSLAPPPAESAEVWGS